MKTFYKMAMVIGALTLCASESQAVPIYGEVIFTGTGTMKLGAADSTAALGDGITFTNPVVVQTAISTGSYDSISLGTTATFTNLVGGSAIGVVSTVGPLAVSPFWTFIDGGTTYSFELTSVTMNMLSGSQRVVEGQGIASISGGSYTPTFGTWQLSTSGSSSRISFSSATSVPDGGSTVALLGMTVVGLGVLRRKLAMA